MVYNKFDFNYIVTAEVWNLIGHTFQLLKPFYIVKQKCKRNNALLSSVFPHVEVLFLFKSFKTISPSGQSGSTTLAVLGESIKKI